jgi:putative component of membrane protein insertase Oxa1/YidC/SpoIIIJ protein YidD
MISQKKTLPNLINWGWSFFNSLRKTALFTTFGFYSGCKHKPSCSQYTFEQIKNKGLITGGLGGLKRILSCY